MQMRTFQKINLFLIFFFGLSFLAFVFLNGGALAANLRYSLLWHTPLVDADLKTENLVDVNLPAGVHPLSASEVKEMTLSIPKIDVNAPVILASEESNQGILTALESGVGLFPDSAKPGAEGRAIILGHSSRGSWYRGNYAYVFALLPKLETYDEFYITTDHTKLVYQVFSKKIMTKAEANTLFNTPTIGSEVNLMTCYPIGSASKRTVIQAKLVRSEAI